MNSLVNFLNLHVNYSNNLQNVKKMIVDTSRAARQTFELDFEHIPPTSEEQKRVAEFLRRQNIDFSDDWFVKAECQEFCRLRQKFSYEVNQKILEHLEDKIHGPINEHQFEKVLRQNTKNQNLSWSKTVHSVFFWEEIQAIIDQKVDLEENITINNDFMKNLDSPDYLKNLTVEVKKKLPGEVRSYIKQLKVYRSKFFKAYGINFFDYARRCRLELNQFKSSFNTVKELLIRRCHGHATSQKGTCLDFFEFKRTSGPKGMWCPDGCKSRIAKYYKRKRDNAK